MVFRSIPNRKCSFADAFTQSTSLFTAILICLVAKFPLSIKFNVRNIEINNKFNNFSVLNKTGDLFVVWWRWINKSAGIVQCISFTRAEFY